MGIRVQYISGDRMPNSRLTFLGDLPSVNRRRQAKFSCDCGKIIERDLNWVRFGTISSCGCYKSELVTAKNTKHGHATRENTSGAYRSWAAMHQRVKSDPHYVNIAICAEWYSFEEFYNDMGDRPDNLTIERIDNTLGYYKGNCTWATRAVQAQNTITTVLVTIDGQTNSIQAWCRIKGIGYHVVKQRRARGMSLEDAITTPINTSKQGRKQNG